MKPVRINLSERGTPTAREAGSSPAARRILIVEDNFFVADQCERALTEAGHQVVGIVATAEQALEVMPDRKPDLVLMDIFLAGARDGIDAARDVFERFGVRSIFVSAAFDLAMRNRAEEAQPLGWLPKPFSDGKLVATVRAAIEDLAAQPAVVR